MTTAGELENIGIVAVDDSMFYVQNLVVGDDAQSLCLMVRWFRKKENIYSKCFLACELSVRDNNVFTQRSEF